MLVQVVTIGKEETTGSGDKKYKKRCIKYLDQSGKERDKWLVDFAFKDVYSFFSSIMEGAHVEISIEKNAKGFWDWVGVEPAGEGAVSKPTGGAPVRKFVSESDSRQRSIVRQSSLKAAVDTIKTDKVASNPSQVMEVATMYETWVNRPEDPVKAIADMEDDIPQ